MRAKYIRASGGLDTVVEEESKITFHFMIMGKESTSEPGIT